MWAAYLKFPEIQLFGILFERGLVVTLLYDDTGSNLVEAKLFTSNPFLCGRLFSLSLSFLCESVSDSMIKIPRMTIRHRGGLVVSAAANRCERRIERVFVKGKKCPSIYTEIGGIYFPFSLASRIKMISKACNIGLLRLISKAIGIAIGVFLSL